MATERIRVQRKHRQYLKRLQEHPVVHDNLEDEDPTYEQVLNYIYDEIEYFELERPEEDMVWVNLGPTAYERTHKRAGKNESAHDVIEEAISKFEDQTEFEVMEGDDAE